MTFFERFLTEFIMVFIFGIWNIYKGSTLEIFSFLIQFSPLLALTIISTVYGILCSFFSFLFCAAMRSDPDKTDNLNLLMTVLFSIGTIVLINCFPDKDMGELYIIASIMIPLTVEGAMYEKEEKVRNEGRYRNFFDKVMERVDNRDIVKGTISKSMIDEYYDKYEKLEREKINETERFNNKRSKNRWFDPLIEEDDDESVIDDEPVIDNEPEKPKPHNPIYRWFHSFDDMTPEEYQNYLTEQEEKDQRWWNLYDEAHTDDDDI